MKKLLSIALVFSVITLFSGLAVLSFGATAPVYGVDSSDVLAQSTINLSGTTDTITDLFTQLIPLIAIISIVGGLMRALPEMFDFKFKRA